MMFRIEIGVKDVTGQVVLTMFANHASKLIKKSAADLLAKYPVTDSSPPVFPEELNILINMKFAFKIEISKYNFDTTYQVYTILKLSDDPEVVLELEKRLEGIQVQLMADSKSPSLSNSAFMSTDRFVHKDVLSQTDEDNVTPMSKVYPSYATPQDLDLKRKLSYRDHMFESPSQSASKVPVFATKDRIEDTVDVQEGSPLVEE